MVISHQDRTIIDLEEYTMPVLALIRRVSVTTSPQGQVVIQATPKNQRESNWFRQKSRDYPEKVIAALVLYCTALE
jgi:hypothetical protein